MLKEDPFPLIRALEIDLKEVYPYALRCALYLDSCKSRVSAAEYSVTVATPPSSASRKSNLDLLLLLVDYLAEHLEKPKANEIIRTVFQNSLTQMKPDFVRFAAFLRTITQDNIEFRMGNVEALVMLFNSSIQPPMESNFWGFGRSPSAVSAPSSDEITRMFIEMLSLILSEEFHTHTGCSSMLQQLEACEHYCGPGERNGSSEIAGERQTMGLYVKKLFGWSTEEYTKLVKGYKPVCTTQSHFHDVKKCLVNLELNAVPYFTPDEFLSPEGHASWKTQERFLLSQTVTKLVLDSPELLTLSVVSGKNSPTDYSSRSFVFVPGKPHEAYRALVTLVTRYELIDQQLPSLSAAAHDLLNDCAMKWRIPKALRVLARLEVVAYAVAKRELGFGFLATSIKLTQAYVQEHPCQEWAARNRNHLLSIYLFLIDHSLDLLFEGITDPPKMSQPVACLLQDNLDFMFGNFVFQEAAITRAGYIDSAMDRVDAALTLANERLYKDDEAVLLQLQGVMVNIERDIGLLGSLFPRPLLGIIDVPVLAAERMLQYFLQKAESILFDKKNMYISVEEALNFHEAVTRLFRFGQVFAPELEEPHTLIGWFKMQFSKWIAALDGQALDWVERAIKYDTFMPISESCPHSSSVTDLICSFREQLEFIQKLTWPSELLQAQSLTKVTKVIYESIQLYSSRMEQLFIPHTSHHHHASSLGRINWKLLNGKKKLNETATIAAPKYIAINNIYHLRTKVQRLFNTIDYDHFSKVLETENHGKDANRSTSKMFSITVREAELLKNCDGNKDNDAYVVLSTQGRKLLTTSVQWTNAHPKWNESVAVALSYGQDIIVQVFDKDTFRDDICGEGFLHLCPQDNWGIEDTDLWVNLEPQGRILLTISSQEETNDSQYFIHKAVYFLEHTENELLKQLSSKFLTPINRHLTRQALLSGIAAKDSTGIRRFLGQDVLPHEFTFSDEDCDDALAPLVEFLDSELQAPFSNLYAACGSKLVLLLWRECLNHILAELIPPFSNSRAVPQPLTKSELDFFMRAVKLLKQFFHGGKDGDGLSNEMLETSDYLLVQEIPELYTASTEDLIEAYMSFYKKFVVTNPKVRSPGAVKADLLLRLIRMRNEKSGIEFVNIQLEIKSKMLEWSVDRSLPAKLA
ncbi:hypothetical protein DSO57_1034445 [Entomophthora muscae]|uniref:Uncharacterized protein n=1 Tax=Entomophthora muscae TaxID=34485 RepID=A0ACC2TYW6_9FUNG|nr:hypothetical protein DSO57_1034445 [Entomophthora muscae]